MKPIYLESPDSAESTVKFPFFVNSPFKLKKKKNIALNYKFRANNAEKV